MHNFTVESGELKIVADYCNCSVPDAAEFDFIEFFSLLRDAVIYNNMQSDKGNEWLDNAWILQQTKPDRKRLREKFGKEDKHVE